MRILFIYFLLASTLFADNAAVQLTGPEVMKLDWGVRALAKADVDQDGREDIGVINNDRARVEIYYQRPPGEISTHGRSLKRNRWEPVLEDSRFEMEGVASGIAMYDLEMGDITGDGLPDVVYTSKDEPLVAVAQLEKGVWAEKREYDGLEALPWNSTMKLVELSDVYPGLELVALTKNRLVVFAFDENADPVKLYETYRMDSTGMDLDVLPAKGDKPLRFSYRVPGSVRALRIIEWDPENGPGAELAFSLDATSPSIAWIDPAATDPELVLIEPRTGRLRIERLEKSSPDSGEDWPLEYYSTGAETDFPEAYARGDYNGDGIDDLAVADAANAQIWWLEGNPDGGWKAPRSYPSFQGVESLAAADIDGDGQSELFVLSKNETIIGLTRWNGDRFVFPQAIGLSGDPKKILWLPEKQQLVALTSQKSDQQLAFLAQTDNGWTIEKQFTLPDVRREPSGILLADLDQNGSQDLLITIPRDGARYVDLAMVDGLPDDRVNEAIFEIDGLREIDLSNVGLGDINDDGLEELLVASDGFVRAIYLDTDKRRTVLDQFNSRSGNDHLSIPHLRDIDGDGVTELLIFDQRDKSFQVLRRDDAGIYRYTRTVKFGDFNPIALMDMGEGNQDMVLLGKTALVRSPLGGTWEALRTVTTYESDLDDIVYNQIAIAELNQTSGAEFILIDGQNNVLEIIKRTPPDGWKSALHFNVFEEDLHYGGRKGAPLEPREVILGDFTNDGLQDIVLLVHDRLLLYPQGENELDAGKAVN
ncbi:FG-GAP repeat domain-containing protein [Cerasicoccus arenae]|uniref:VCBS repeat-containing protein n=1 Tax=Cerasicoccus arenae TaxID=424488 RepID=A0A8J3GGA4_9BACT|nr:VCBS repeat-containing protein [Cerasicoccus arenae]MBK1856640.1 VCBS repeat-containing protein [Cerasicoccus arenae]GHC12288.1 hypothetical protein GCM10007047_32060 [Cerasicoccus arenae]